MNTVPHQTVSAIVRACIIAFAIFTMLTCNRDNKLGERPSISAGRVTVAKTETQRTVTALNLSGPGTVSAYNTVIVRSRIDGQLLHITFHEGQDVKAGDLLAVIDPRPYEGALNQLEATINKDKALLQDAEVALQRYHVLFDSKLIAEQQLDTQAAAVRQAEGTVRVDEAQIEMAKLNLAYTQITSPIDGRVGLRLVDAGNMVRSSDVSGLVTVSQLKPIGVQFTLPQQFWPSLLKSLKQSFRIKVFAYTPDDKIRLGSGTLLTVDSQLDPTTGTPRAKAVFDNVDLALWPNQLVNIHLTVSEPEMLLSVPEIAIHRRSEGLFVYLVKTNKTIEVRPVILVKSEGGKALIIGTGLNEGDAVVTNVDREFRNGDSIELSPNPD